MKKRLLVTGIGGFVAGSVVAQGRKEWDIDAVSSPNRELVIDEVRCHSFDLRNRGRLLELFEAQPPAAVIHTAAKADIDYCQNNQNEAEETNVGVTWALAELCNRFGSKLISCSTDTVFDGKQGDYSEEDPPNPVNFYGETKFRAEKIVLEMAKKSVVARLSLVMGFPVYGAGNSFLAKAIAHLQIGQEIRFPSNEIRTPIDVITLGRSLLELAGNDFRGILHLAGNTRLNRHEIGCQIAEHLGFSKDLVKSTNSNAMPDRAPRPNDASLNNTKARTVLNTPMRGLIEGLDHVMQFKEKNYE